MRRHDRVYLAPSAPFQTACAAAGSPAWQGARDWIDRGLPLVAARQPEGTQGLLLGLTLPSASGRRRLTIAVSPATVREVQPPMQLSGCLARLPAAMAPVLHRFEATLADAGVRLGVYGSLAWEALSGDSYRHADSDIDVICDVTSTTGLDTALSALAQADAALPCALDGEIRFPDGHAVAWREIAAQRQRDQAPVLAKGETAVGLVRLDALLATLATEVCHA